VEGACTSCNHCLVIVLVRPKRGAASLRRDTDLLLGAAPDLTSLRAALVLALIEIEQSLCGELHRL
jgi:hypothetical protein